MNLYEQWLQKADDIGLSVVESVPFESNAKGLIRGDCIGLNQKIETMAERTCVLAEEVIHSQVNVGNILDQRISDNDKQERKARKILHHHVADLNTIIRLLKEGYKKMDEIAEKMGITEALLAEAICGYKEEYGISISIGDDVLFFEPTVFLKSQIDY